MKAVAYFSAVRHATSMSGVNKNWFYFTSRKNRAGCSISWTKGTQYF